MIPIIHNIKEKKRKGVSTVIGTLFMLAIVTSVGSVLAIQGIAGITSFNTFLAIFSEEGESESVHESILIEHVRFDPDSTDKDVEFWLRNNGLERVGIDRITMVKVDTQELIINKDFTNPAVDLFGEELEKIIINNASATDVTLPGSCASWDSASCGGSLVLADHAYRISVTTARGNSFETIARPFNT